MLEVALAFDACTGFREETAHDA
ncbi:hypothetical protein RAZWK3B_01555 [Roseobacter sp. AzwK-3b]|nr:hypothetical protein RAZWK3B_01555 [Roseobacter sp. AzwK-3b]